MPDIPLIIENVRQTKGTVQSIRESIINEPQHYQRQAFYFASKLIKNNTGLPPNRETFIEQINNNMSTAIYNIANYESYDSKINLDLQDHQLLCGWYFPELFQSIKATVATYNILILVSQDPPWFEQLKNHGHTLNFNAPGAAGQLIAEMQNGRNIFAMLDNIYPTTQTISSGFLGKTIDIPCSILQLALSNNYTLVFLAPRNRVTEVSSTIETANKTVQELADWYTINLSAEINKDPAKWIMWPRMRSTMIKVDS